MLLSNLQHFVFSPSWSPIVQDFSVCWWLVVGELLPGARTEGQEVHENQDHSLSPSFHHIPPSHHHPHPAAGLKLLHGTTFALDVTMGFPSTASPLTWGEPPEIQGEEGKSSPGGLWSPHVGCSQSALCGLKEHCQHHLGYSS